LAQDMLSKSASSDTYEGACRSNSDGNIRTAGIVGINAGVKAPNETEGGE